MNKKLTFIREKCIAANPDRKDGWDWDSGRPEGSGYMDHSPCRLADVLLAMREQKRIWKALDIGRGAGSKTPAAAALLGKSRYAWNLRADDLEQQSEETINFLYDLLK